MNQCQADSSQQQGLSEQQMGGMPYTTAIIKEVLRHRGIVSHVWRTALVDLEVGGYRVPKVQPCPIPPHPFCRYLLTHHTFNTGLLQTGGGVTLQFGSFVFRVDC